MKKYFFFIIFFLGGLSAYAQSTISGKILDSESQEPLLGASVLYGPGKGTVTDFDGNYSLNLEKGDYELTISYVGYKNQVLAVSVDSKPVVLNIDLTPDILLDEVVVTADIANERETPVAFSNIPTMKINEELGAQDIPMVLNSTPGVYATESGGGDGDARITIRGFNQRNVAVMLDGVPVNDMENGWVYWSNWFGLDLVTKTMQVQRGLGASKLAVPSIGGTINILTKGIDSKRNISFKQEVGNNGYLRSTLGITSGRLDNGWGISAAASYKRGNGWVDGNFTEGFFYYLRVDKEIGKHIFSLSGFGAPQKHGQRAFKSAMTDFDAEYARNLFEGSDEQYTQLNQLSVLENSRLPNGSTDDEIDAAIRVARQQLVDDGYAYFDEDGDFVRDHELWSNLVDTTGALNRGLRFNENVGLYDGEEFSVRQNYYHKPQFTFRHTWTPGANRFLLSNTAYLSIGNGGGIGPASPINFEDIGSSGGILRSSINNHFWYGLLSTARYDLSDSWFVSGGADLRYYRGDHKRIVYDLLGNESYADGDNVRNPIGTELYEDDVIERNYSGFVRWGGLFGLLEYKTPRFAAFLNLSGSMNSYSLEDFYKKKVVELADTTLFIGSIEPVTYQDVNYTVESPEAQNQTIDWIDIPGFTAKTGAKFNVSENQSVFFNTGFLSKAQRFNNVIQSNSNNPGNPLAFKEYDNERVYAIELGYNFRSTMFSANLNAYNTIWDNKPVDSPPSVAIDPTDPESIRVPINIVGLSALHRGIELDFVFKPIKKLALEGIASVGDWTWNSTATSIIPGIGNTPPDTTIFDPRGVHVGDAAQLQLGGHIRYEPIKGLYFKFKGTYFGNNYADFQPEDLKVGLGNEGRESWKLPNYAVFSFHTGYRLPIKKVRMDLRLNIQNLFNAVYVTDARNNDPFVSSTNDFDANSASVFFGQGRRWSTSLRISL